MLLFNDLLLKKIHCAVCYLNCSCKHYMAKAAKKSGRRPGTSGENKLGVKNSLVNNINARRKKGISRSKKDSTVSDKSYTNMQNKWEKPKE